MADRELCDIDRNEILNFINLFLENSGYFSCFNKKIAVEFDSDENVKKNYKGNYYYRLL